MKTDQQIAEDVGAELAWDDRVEHAGIRASVSDGVATLRGKVSSIEGRRAAARAAQRVPGVQDVEIDLQVRPGAAWARSDAEITQRVAYALRCLSLVPDGVVEFKVADGCVTLTGQVQWRYQATSAERCLQTVSGVRGVTNALTVKSRALAVPTLAGASRARPWAAFNRPAQPAFG